MRYIYTLADPKDHIVRYIGQTKDPIKRELSHNCDKSKTHKGHWIRSVRNAGRRVELTVILICEEDVINQYEIGSKRKKSAKYNKLISDYNCSKCNHLKRLIA
jgi:hypothetical protein